MTTTTQQPTPLPTHTERALATVEVITDLREIPDAEFIVCARIRGWDVVVKRDEFQVGDPCVYFEVDTMLEVADPRFDFLTARGVRTNGDGSYGHVLKTARLRGQYSQGLALPQTAFPELADLAPGTDVTELLPVMKFEPPLPDDDAARGYRPSWITSTDEERIQNLNGILRAGAGLRWAATEKLDGRSTTFYVDPAEEYSRGVCSRNIDLHDVGGTAMWELSRKHQVHDLLEATYPGRRAVVQGETFGAGIQGNPLQLNDKRFAAFNLIVDGVTIRRAEWPEWLAAIAVPVHDLPFPASLEEALEQVETLKSAIAASRAAEGLVWRAVDTTHLTVDSGYLERASFKVVSNKYLLKHDR